MWVITRPQMAPPFFWRPQNGAWIHHCFLRGKGPLAKIQGIQRRRAALISASIHILDCTYMGDLSSVKSWIVILLQDGEVTRRHISYLHDSLLHIRHVSWYHVIHFCFISSLILPMCVFAIYQPYINHIRDIIPYISHILSIYSPFLSHGTCPLWWGFRSLCSQELGAIPFNWHWVRSWKIWWTMGFGGSASFHTKCHPCKHVFLALSLSISLYKWYVYMYLYIYICIHIIIYIYIFTGIHTYIHTLHTYIHTYIHT